MHLSDIVFKEELFYSKIIKTPDGCWEWCGVFQSLGKKRLGAGQRMGYGQFSVRYVNGDKKGGTLLAHRLMWILLNGEINDALMVCHHCDNPKCVHPEHLYLASQSQNMKDCVERGRHAMANRTHCPHGHEYVPENTIVYTTKSGFNERKCRQCHRESQKTYRNKKKMAGEAGLEPATQGLTVPCSAN